MSRALFVVRRSIEIFAEACARTAGLVVGAAIGIAFGLWMIGAL